MDARAITVRLMDGLGNQLFQYALGRKLATSLGAPLQFDTSWYDDRSPPPAQHRALALRDFAVTGHFVAGSDFSRFWTRPASRGGCVRWWLEQALLPPRRRRFVQQDPARFLRGRMFDPRVLDVRAGSYLCGWWISPKYFAGIEPELRRELVPRERPSARTEAYLAKVAACESVAIHIRRGDYMNHPAIGCLGASYYARAIEWLSARIERPKFFVFSDDPAAARELLKGVIAEFEVVKAEPQASPSADLFVMAACKHFITANSTFSWWGAWLSRNREKKVIAPAHWFVGARVVVEDVYPDDWVRMAD